MESSHDAFTRHVDMIRADYGEKKLIFFNLLGMSKDGEVLLTEALASMIKMSEDIDDKKMKEVYHLYFDFVAERKKKRDNLEKFIGNTMDKHLHDIGMFCAKIGS